MDNHFDSKGGGQNVAQGDHAIGKQVNVTQSVIGDGNICSGTGNVTVNNHGVPHEVFAQYVKELSATEQVVEGFFGTLLKEKVPRDQWDSKLREIAATHKELLARLDSVQDADPQVAKLKTAAKQAMDAGDYAKAEALLEDVANQHSLAAAEAHADNARLQEVQLRYAKAAAYWQKAAALLPDDKKKDRAYYLNEAGYDLRRLARSVEAQPLYEQSLSLCREIGDRAGESTMLNNISGIYYARGDYTTALKYLEQSLVIRREIGDRAGEGTTLNNISGIHWARGDYGTALKHLEQSLVIRREIGDRRQEAETSWNIGLAYYKQGDLAKAEQYISRAVQLAEEIGHPSREKYREALKAVRAKLRSK